MQILVKIFQKIILLICFWLWMSVAYGAEAIRVGTSTALSGPSSSLGQDMKIGLETYFRKVNDKGGIYARKIELVALDDGYIPEVAKTNMIRLIERENVLAVIGNVGTPTARVTVPIANQKKTLLFGAFTGSDLLRKDPPDRYVINYRASYADETENIIHGLMKMVIRPFEIAFFTQNDSYGDAGYQGALKALEGLGYTKGRGLPHGRYERNTSDIKEALIKILNAEIKPRAVIMIGSYAPCAKFISIAKRVLPNALFLNVSFVGSNALMRTLGKKGEGVIISQVVPGPAAKLPVVREYKEDLKEYFPDVEQGSVSLEGYIVAKIFIEGLRRIRGEINRENIITALESIKNFDVGLNVPLTYSPTEHSGITAVWPVIIRNGKFQPFNWTNAGK